MYELKVEDSFAAAHNLREYEGECEALHGHNWKVELVARARELDKIGLAMDFKTLKGALDEVLNLLDHRYLNELDGFSVDNPSSENIAKFIFEEVDKKLKDTGAWVHKVTAWESEKACASYLRD